MKTMLLILTALLTITAAANAAIINVPADQPTIQAGIDAATNGDTVIVADGVYIGEGNCNCTIEKSITVKSQNGPAYCIIDCQGLYPYALNAYGDDVNVIFEGFGITNFQRYAIKIGRNASAEIKNCMIFAAGRHFEAGSHHTTYYRDGIYLYHASATITIIDCSISDETYGMCAGIYGADAVTIRNTIIMGATENGIRLGSDSVIENCHVFDNYGYGINIGEMYSSTGGSISNCLIHNNGTYYSSYDDYYHGINANDAVITNCTVLENGYGIDAYPGTENRGLVANCIITGSLFESTTNSIQPINSCFPEADGTNGNISDDPQFSPDGGFMLSSQSPCIDAGTTPDSLLDFDIFGNPRNLDGDNDGQSAPDIGAHEYNPASSAIFVPNIPVFLHALLGTQPQSQIVDVTTAGGSQSDLQFSSPSARVSAIVEQPQTNQHSHKVRIDYDTTDLSPGLYGAELFISDASAVNSSRRVILYIIVGSLLHVPQDYPTIQEAIDNCVSFGKIIVAPGRYKENISFNGKALTLRSTDPTNWDIVKSTIIDGAFQGSCVTFDQGEGPESILEGFTLTRGSGDIARDESFGSADVGGGILCVSSSPVIRYCNITRNGAKVSSSGSRTYATYGGGIALGGDCQANISNCLITQNSATNGGSAISVSMKNGDFEPSTIVNCTIADNDLDYLSRSQISCRYESAVNIINTIIYGHILGISYMADPSTIINSCINSIASDGYGDGLYDLTAYDDIITENPRFVRPADPYDLEDPGDYHLRFDSPCINAGAPGFATVAKDIDGDPRIMGGRVDIGADEVVPKIVATKPFAGEVLVTGSTRIIEWISYVYAGNIDILFTDNNGDTWQTIAADLENSGTYQWHLPDIVDSDQCMIKIIATDYDEPIGYFPSDLFTIHPTNPDVDVDLAWPTLGGSNTRTGLSTTAGPEIGCIKWQFPTDSAIHQSVTIGADDNVHVPTEDGKLYTLSPDGNLLWTYDAGSEITSPPTVGPDGTVFIGTRNGKLCAIDKNSRVRWTHTIGDMIYAAPTVTEDGTIYVGSTDGNLYAIAKDGTSLWTFNLPMIGQIGNSILASPTIGIDGSIYVGGAYSSTLYALDPANGSENWTADWLAGNGFFVSPVVADDGTILVFLLENSMLIAIDHNDGTMLFSSQMAGPITEDVLIAHWPFDGNAYDMTGSHHGTLRNGAAIDSNGNSALGAGALSLDGIDDYVEIDGYKGVEGAKDRTVSGWIKTTAATAILYWGKPELGREWFIRLNSTGALRLKVNGGKVNGTTPLNDDTWHHFAIVFENDGTPDLSDVKFYVDGQLEDVTFSSELAIDTASHENMTIGYGPSSYFAGLIDDVRIYNWAMTAEEIQPMDMPQDESSWFSVDFTERYPDPKCFTEPAIGPDGTIYVSLDDPYLRAVDPDGTIKWVTRLGMVGGFTLTVTQDGLIYAACDDGTLYVVDSDGNELSRFTGSKWLSFPVIAPDGTIYVSDSGSTLWAINSAPCDNAADLHRPADISADGIVNFTDFSLFAADWLNCTDPGTDNGCDSYSTEIQYYPGDIDHNMYVNLSDLMQIADKWLNSN